MELNQHKSQKESLSTGFPVDPKYIPPLPIQFTGDSAESETEIISILNQHLLNVLEVNCLMDCNENLLKL